MNVLSPNMIESSVVSFVVQLCIGKLILYIYNTTTSGLN